MFTDLLTQSHLDELRQYDKILSSSWKAGSCLQSITMSFAVIMFRIVLAYIITTNNIKSYPVVLHLRHLSAKFIPYEVLFLQVFGENQFHKHRGAALH